MRKIPISGYWDIQILIFWGHLLLEFIFYWRSSSFQAFDLIRSPLLKFQIWEKFDAWLLRYSTLNISGSSSIGGCLPFNQVILVQFPELKFKIWERSGQWLLRYSTFNILRSSSIGGRLPFEGFWFGFDPLSFSLKLEENLITSCWDIQLFIFWGRLPLEVIFVLSIFDFGLVP